jgi:Flp pilus assembly protein TadD
MDAESFAAYADESRLLSVLGSVFRFGVLMPLAAAGLWLTRRDWRRLWIFHVAIVALALSITLVFVFARFRISLVVFLIPFAGAGLTSLGAQWREYGGAERAWLALVLVASAALVNWPLHTSSGDARAGTYASYAVVCLEDGRPQQALPLLRKAVALEPDDAELRNDLAIALRKTGDLDAAIVEFGNATRLRPDYPDAHMNLSTALGATPRTAPDYEGRMQAALAECREALRLQPEFPVAQSHLGFLLYERGDLPGAISAWRVALQEDPTDVRSRANLAGALAQQGDVEGAIAEYQRVLELDPDHVAARKLLERLRAAPQGQ